MAGACMIGGSSQTHEYQTQDLVLEPELGWTAALSGGVEREVEVVEIRTEVRLVILVAKPQTQITTNNPTGVIKRVGLAPVGRPTPEMADQGNRLEPSESTDDELAGLTQINDATADLARVPRT